MAVFGCQRSKISGHGATGSTTGVTGHGMYYPVYGMGTIKWQQLQLSYLAI